MSGSYKNFGKTAKSKLYEGKELQSQTPTQRSNILGDLRPKKIEENNVEEQYILGLQDEVKLLEYELKLIKDKESQEVENFSHFFKFFNDGVPINENIIAMKNLYQFTEKGYIDKINKTKEEVEQQQRTVEYLKHDIENLQEKQGELNTLFTTKGNKNTETIDKVYQDTRDHFHTIIYKEPKLKEYSDQLRQKQLEQMDINKRRDQEKLRAEFNQNEKEKERIKIEKQILDLETELLAKQKQKEEDEDITKFEREKLDMEEQLETLRKKILDAKQQINMNRVSQEQIKYDLESLQNSRENDYKQKRKQQALIDDLQEQIEKESKMSEAQMMEKVLEKEKDDIRKIDIEINNIRMKQIQIFGDRLSLCESKLEQMVLERVEMQTRMLTEEDRKTMLDKNIKDLEIDLHMTRIALDTSRMKQEQLNEKLEPLRSKLETMKNEIPKLVSATESYQAQIQQYERQLKSFNFEEVRMIAATNNQVNSSIQQLVRKWEDIDTMGKNLNKGSFIDKLIGNKKK